MADTWAAEGDSSGLTLLKSMFVESIVVLPITPMGVYSIRIRMTSGAEYYGFFASQVEAASFVEEWSGSVLKMDIEPISPAEL